MQDVAVAEASAEKGEIVVSPQAHRLLHGEISDEIEGDALVMISSNSNSSTDGLTREVEANTATSGPAKRGLSGSYYSTSSQVKLACGCTRTSSGYYKLPTAMDHLVCSVEFGKVDPHADAVGAAACDTRSVVSRVTDCETEFDFEIEVYTEVVEDLMTGFKFIRRLLSARLQDSVRTVMEAIELEGTKTYCFLFYFFDPWYLIVFRVVNVVQQNVVRALLAIPKYIHSHSLRFAVRFSCPRCAVMRVRWLVCCPLVLSSCLGTTEISAMIVIPKKVLPNTTVKAETVVGVLVRVVVLRLK
jgi:hypothetical protein